MQPGIPAQYIMSLICTHHRSQATAYLQCVGTTKFQSQLQAAPAQATPAQATPAQP